MAEDQGQARLVHTGIDRYPEEPGGEGSIASKPGQPCVGANQGLLKRIGCVLMIPYQPVRRSVGCSLVPMNQFVECVDISVSGCQNQVRI